MNFNRKASEFNVFVAQLKIKVESPKTYGSHKRPISVILEEKPLLSFYF